MIELFLILIGFGLVIISLVYGLIIGHISTTEFASTLTGIVSLLGGIIKLVKQNGRKNGKNSS